MQSIWKKTVCFLALLLVHNLVAFALSRSFHVPSEWYLALEKAPWQPPAYVFAPVWTLMYGLMSLSLTIVLSHPSIKTKALSFYFAHLLLNFSWTPVFFGLHAPKMALFLLLLIMYLLFYCMRYFYHIQPKAAYLLLPYFFWLLFASSLNLYIVLNQM